MARYLKSLSTGCVLPYVEASLKSSGVRLMDPTECAEYEASLNKPVAKAAPTPAVETLPDPEVLVVEPEVGEMIVEDFEPTDEVEAVLGALETD